MASSSPYGSAVLAALMGALMPVAAAQGQELPQQYRPDPEGYPCNAKSRLTITQQDQGFAIRSVSDTQNRVPVPRLDVPIGVGATMKLDTALLRGATSLKEVVDAPRR